MRVAVVTSLTTATGANGEDHAALDQAQLLAEAGHAVSLITRSSDELAGQRGYLARSAVRVATGLGGSPLAEIEQFGPDVVHVHNTYPNLGRAWAKDLDVPLVVTLHSFRFYCAVATAFRDGRPCTDCVTAPRSAVRHGCYGGRARSAPYAIAGLRRGSDPLLRRADRIIVLNPRLRELLLASGFDAGRIVLGTNSAPELAADSELAAGSEPEPRGVASDAAAPEHRETRRWLYAGRLTPEKGLVRMLRNWPAGEPLDVVGDGPQRAEVADVAGPDVRLLGWRDRASTRRAMAGAAGLLIPSEWFEGLPLVYVEALAAGLPVIAYEPNNAATLVARDGTGIATTWDEPLPAVLTRAREAFPDLRQHCRDVFASDYSPAALVRQLEDAYAAAGAAV